MGSSPYDRPAGSGGSPYDRGRSSGGSPYDRSSTSSGGHSSGPHHSVHGIGGFFHNLAHGAEAAASGFGPGLGTFGKDFGHDALKFAEHPIRYNPKRDGKLRGDIVLPLAHQYKTKYYDPISQGNFGKLGSNVYKDPFGTFLDASMFLTSGAGVAARAGSLAEKAGMLSEGSRFGTALGRVDKIEVPNPAKRLGQEDGANVTIKNSSHNPVIRTRQMLVNKLLNLAPHNTPLFGSSARFSRFIWRNNARAGMALALKGRAFAAAFHKLDKNERAVWHVQARKVEPEMWKNLLDEGAVNNPYGTEAATMKQLDKAKFVELYRNGNSKIEDALQKGRALSDLMTDEKVRRGLISETSAAEAPYAALRSVNGADFIGAKEAKRTEPPKRLIETTRQIAVKQKAYDEMASRVKSAGFTRDQQKLINASAKLPPGPDIETIVPKTLDEAKAHLEKLQGVYDQFLQDAGGTTKLDPGEMARQREINTDNGKFRRQQSGKTAAGKHSGSSGAKIQRLTKDVNVQKRIDLEQHVHDVALAHPELPAAQKFLKLSKKIDDLHAAINAHEERGFLSDQLESNAALGTKTITKPGERVKPFPLPSGKMITAEGAMLAPKGSVMLGMKGAELSLLKTRHAQLERAYANRLAKLGGFKERGVADLPGHSIPELAQGLADQGRMQPFYVHDQAVTKRPLFNRAARKSFTKPPKPGSGYQNQQILFGRGAINLHGDSLSHEFSRFARDVSRSDVHDVLVEHHAAKVPELGIPSGWTHLLAKGESAPSFLEKNAGEIAKQLSKGETKDDLLKLFTSKDKNAANIAVDGDGHKLMIPDAVAKMLTTGARSDAGLVRHLLLDSPTSFWKHMVLGLRPAYMANILLSQHILGALQMAPDGHGLFHYLNNAVPGARLDKMTAETVAKYYPEQAHGSFAESVRGGVGKGSGGRVGRVLRAGYEGVMPATLKAENWLRRAMVAGWSEASPEVRAAMARNGGDINAAVAEVARTHPHVIDEISQKVDHAQGNYRDYSPAEQKLRAVIPFYGWDRHIVQSTYRILGEHPIRADLAANLGTQGHAINERDFGALPTYLQDLMKIGPADWLFGKAEGRATGISTKAIGPFSADRDLAQTLWSIAHGRAGTHTEEAGNLNPILAGIYEQLTGRSLLTGAPLKDKLNQGMFNIPLRVGLETPQARLVEELLHLTPLGKPKHTPASQVTSRLSAAGYFGLPVKRLDLAHEHLIAALQNKPPR